jgi:hypothetical protein
VQRKVALGIVVSELLRKGLRTDACVKPGKGGFPVFDVPADARPITIDTVKDAEDEL